MIVECPKQSESKKAIYMYLSSGNGDIPLWAEHINHMLNKAIGSSSILVSTARMCYPFKRRATPNIVWLVEVEQYLHLVLEGIVRLFKGQNGLYISKM